MNDLIDFKNLGLVEFSAAIIVTNVILSLLLSLVITWVYQKTHRGISYSQSFVVSLVMMSVLSSIAMMILGNNLIRALGILGVFTLLRFRTIIKDTRDATYLFFALAMGMAVGTNNYTIAVLGTGLLSTINMFLDRINYGSNVREGFLLTLMTVKDFGEENTNKHFDKSLKSYKLLQIKTQSTGAQEYYYSVRFKNGVSQGEFVKSLQNLSCVDFVDLVSSRDAAEY